MPAPQLEIDWPAYADEIGRRVKAVREARKVSQIELAGATGISRTQIQNIEQSRSFKTPNAGNTTVYRLFLIAQALGVSPRTFIPETVPTSEYRQVLDLNWPEIEIEVTLETLKYPIPASTVRSIHVQSPVNLYPDEENGQWIARRSAHPVTSPENEIVGSRPIKRDAPIEKLPEILTVKPAVPSKSQASPNDCPIPDWLAHLPRPSTALRRHT